VTNDNVSPSVSEQRTRMIVRPVNGSLRLFAQVDHAAVCGALASRWHRDLGAVPATVVTAAAVHDDGWREWDRHPRLDDGTGRPHPYSDMPGGDYREVWERCLARGWARGNEIGLLVSLHGMRFFASREDRRDRAILERERERQAGALARLGTPTSNPADPPSPWGIWHAWIYFWDALSLFMCGEFGEAMQQIVPRIPGDPVEIACRRAGGERMVLEPFPFEGPVQLEIPYREISVEVYADQEALDRAMADADSGRLRIQLTPPDSKV